jgi:thiosulfate/3-mercaptopyruvate sulfurtransferase
VKSQASTVAFCGTFLGVLFSACAFAGAESATSIPSAALIQPAQLASTLGKASGGKPLILQVGFRKLYDQAHIAGAEYAGAGREEEGLRALQERAASVPKEAAIVLYCGCCPWRRCPNIAAAYDALHALGFRNVKVLYIADNFGSDWVEKGYPTATGH